MMETKKLAKHGLVYSLTSIMAQGVTLLMVPVYTKNMSLEQFGQYNLLISIQSLLAIIITLGIYSGLTRFINEFEDKNRTKNVAMTFSLIWGGIMCLLSAKFGSSIYDLIFPPEKSGGFYINFIVISSVLFCLICIYNSYYTMLFKSKLVSSINLFRAVLMLLYAVYFVIIRKKGLDGALLAQLFAFATILAGLIIYDRKNLRIVFARKELTYMLKYGMGLMLGQASAWVYTLIDRYFIKALIGLQQVAIYSIGYRIGMIMEPILLTPFKSIFTPFKYKVYKEVDAPKKIQEIFVYYNFMGWFCILGFSVFAKPAIHLLSTNEYIVAFKVVPLIVFSYFLNGLGEFYSLGIHIKNKSMVDSYILGAGALINILLNIVLIPRLNIMGAALATVLSYFIMNVLYFWIGKRYLDLGLQYFTPFKGGVLFAGLYGGYLVVDRFINNLVYDFVFASLLCLVFIYLGILMRLIPREAVKTTLFHTVGKYNLRYILSKHKCN